MRACDAAPGCPARQALRVVQGCLFLRQIAREGVKAMKSVLYLVILKSFNSAVRDHGRIFSLPLLPLFVLAAAGVQPALANGVNATIGNGQVVTGTVTGSGVDSYTFPAPASGSIFASLSDVGPHIFGNDLRIGSGANAPSPGDDEECNGSSRSKTVFKGRHFDGQIIILCVTWYTSFKLSLRDLVIMMADRGISVTHTTILRWVQRYLPEFEKRWRRYARPVGGSWRMDETYIKVHGQWVYLYRAVDKAGQTVDFFLSRNRDVNAAKSFLRSAMKNTRVPTKITLDAYAASHRAVREMKEDGELPGRVKVRSSQYLNNLVEQDHRRVKQRIRPMLGFKRFDNAVVTISGIELAEKIKKGQFKTGKLGGRNATMTELWNAALAA